jgi:Predicted membrane protein
MNRIKFMKELEVLLAGISVSERTAAMQYYNDYFDDAGTENEMHIISELGSPMKVAEIIKGGYRNDEKSSEYSETGYTDTRFESKEEMMKKEMYRNGQKENGKYKNNSKTLLWIVLAVFAAPIVLPLLGALLATLVSVLVALFAVMLSLVLAAASIAIAGIAVFIAGCTQLGIFLPLGLALIGAGLIIFVIGLVATVFSGKVCVIVIPCVVRGFVALCRKPFHRKVVSA